MCALVVRRICVRDVCVRALCIRADCNVSRAAYSRWARRFALGGQQWRSWDPVGILSLGKQIDQQVFTLRLIKIICRVDRVKLLALVIVTTTVKIASSKSR
ncbi:hypothetical protein EVAR_97101_1 [Eumeta japonica]|uniref:Uncharacterized protein n=1 Tax=Eumeta variegata TaxID=151549 RepID=A0A4C1X4P8_EUMVA|nr:hypothetical protein EVAR_97101_1 [Eumeta japonica]